MFKRFLLALLFLLPIVLSAQTLCVQVDCKQTIQLPKDSAVLHDQIFTTGTVNSAVWTGPTSFISGTNKITVHSLTAGTYVYTFTVVTTVGSQTLFDTVVVNAIPANKPPTGTAVATHPIVTHSTTNTLTCTAIDPNGQGITAFRWRKISGPGFTTISSSSHATCTVNGLLVGKYTYRCTFWNKANLSSSATVTFTVSSTH